MGALHFTLKVVGKNAGGKEKKISGVVWCHPWPHFGAPPPRSQDVGDKDAAEPFPLVPLDPRQSSGEAVVAVPLPPGSAALRILSSSRRMLTHQTLALKDGSGFPLVAQRKSCLQICFLFFSRIWVSTVDLATQSSILLSGGGGR